LALSQPLQPAFAALGDYIVTDVACDCLRSVDHTTGAASNIASGLIHATYGVVVDSNGNYVVTDGLEGKLRSVNHITGAVSTIATGVAGATAIAMDSNQ